MDALDPHAPLVSPEIAARLARLSLQARRMPEARRRGRRRTRRPGGGADFIDTRPYALGDDPRRIAWPAFARLERLLVRLVADDAPLRLALVVDTSSSMGFSSNGAPSKLVQAARIAAGLATVALTGEDRVGVVSSSSTASPVLRASGGRIGLGRLYGALDALAPSGTTDLGAAASAASRATGGRALCVILSDFLDPAGALAGARAMCARGHEVALVEVLDPQEIDPPDLSGHDLEDQETGEIVVLPAEGATEAYLAALATHRAAIDAGAAEIGAPVLRVSTTEPFDSIVCLAIRAGLLRSQRT
ncbi:MAG: DUF58 domain-containing protein [Deltaproteobacteria bacterium]|nr:DUF58 domain-containing protein [Deltaproteobacteria bacterium]